MKCVSCQVDSLPDQRFAVERIPFLGARNYCANCHSRLHRKLNLGFCGTIFLFGILALVTGYRNPETLAGNYTLGFCLFMIFMAASIFAHELGHALTAQGLGFQVQRIVIGVGPLIHRGSVLGMPWEIRQLPTCGFCNVIARKPAWQRTRFLMVVLAGPLTNLAIAMIASGMAGHNAELFVAPILAPSIWRVLLYANIYLAVISLIPFQAELASDGLLILRILFPQLVLKQIPSAQSATSRKRTWFNGLLRWCIVVFLILCGLTCLGIDVLLLSQMKDGNLTAGLWFAMIVFAMLAGTLAWFAYRAARDPDVLPTASPQFAGVHPMDSLNRTFAEELAADAAGPNLEWRTTELVKLQEAWLLMELPQGRTILEDALVQWPRSLELKFYLSELLTSEGSAYEAQTLLESLLDESLGPKSRIMFLERSLKLLIRRGEYATTRQRAEKYLGSAATDADKVTVLDMLACVPLQENLPGYLPEAVRWNEKALRLQPGLLTLRGTRGALLVEAGRWEEAEAELKAVAAQSESDTDQGICAFYLGLVAKKRHDIREAARLARRARMLHPQPWLLARIKAEFPTLVAQ